MSKEHKRKIYMDVLRILAIFMVLYNHQPTYTYFLEAQHHGIIYFCTMIFSIICKSAPPLFFMISGALLLKKDEEISFIWKHRISRIVIVMVIAAVWSARAVLVGDIRSIFQCLGNSNWYLFAYLTYLILLPFIRPMIRGMNRNAVKLFFVLAFLVYPISGIMAGLGAQNQFSYYMVYFTSDWPSKCWHLMFPILGYYLANDEYFTAQKNEKKNLVVLIIATLLNLLCGAVMMIFDVKNSGGANLEMIRQFFILAPTCLIFYACKLTFDRIQDKVPAVLSKLIVMLSSATFGVYLLEVYTPISHDIYNAIGPRIVNYVGVYLSYLLPIFVSLCVYTIIILILKKIPYVKKLL